MTNTNTNNLEVLFQDLCEEDTASISGGFSTAIVSISPDGSSVSATAKTDTRPSSVTNTPTVDLVKPGTGTFTTFLNSSSPLTFKSGSFSLTLSLPTI